MADLTIGQLTKADEMTDDALLPLEQGGEARVITGALIKRYALDSVQPVPWVFGFWMRLP